MNNCKFGKCNLCNHKIIQNKRLFRSDIINYIHIANQKDVDELYDLIKSYYKSSKCSEEELLDMLDTRFSFEFDYVHLSCLFSKKEYTIIVEDFSLEEFKGFLDNGRETVRYRFLINYTDLKLLFNTKHSPKYNFNIDPISFINSCYRKGTHFIFVCDCGDAGCDGWFKGVYVDHKNNEISWVLEDLGEYSEKIIFPKEKYLELAEEMIERLKNIKSENPNIIYDLDSIGTPIEFIISCYKNNEQNKLIKESGIYLVKFEKGISIVKACKADIKNFKSSNYIQRFLQNKITKSIK